MSSNLGSPHPSVYKFFALAAGISWVLGLVVAAVLQAVLPDTMDRASLLLAKFGPSIAGVIMAYAVSGKRGITHLLRATFRFRTHIAGYAIALLVPPLIWAIALFIHYRSGAYVDWTILGSIRAPDVLLALGTFVFLGGGLGEELGWRGFALPILQRTMSAGRATLILGVAWAVWHYPALLLDNDPGATPIWLFTAFVLAVSVLMTSLYNATGGNVLLMVLFHASFNASESLLEDIVLVESETALEMWMAGLYAALAALLFLVFRGKNLSRRPRTIWPGE